MQWHHILDKQPEHNELIIHIEPPWDDGCYLMTMRKYFQPTTFQKVLDYYKKSDIDLPDFWWMSAKDFPFPVKPKDGK